MRLWIKKWQQAVNRRLMAVQVVFAAIFIFLNEWLYRHTVGRTLTWCVHHPVFLMMNLACLIALMAGINLIVKRQAAGPIAVMAVSLTLGGINAGKYALRNVPLTVHDLTLIKEIWVLRDNLVTWRLMWSIGAAVVAMIIMGIGISKCIRKAAGAHEGVTNATLLILSIALLGCGQVAFDSHVPLERTGFIYALSNQTRIKPLVDNNVLKEASVQIEDEIRAYVNREPYTEGVKPNVIIIMSEAFWDINKMGVEMTGNPVAYFEKLRNESTYGELYVPVVGGGTVNTEFEVMTGMTVKNYDDDWYMVYPNEIKNNYPSLASIYRNQGYTSVALHPYLSWYYNRYEVYRHFGFNDFESLEFMGDTEKYGSFTKDSETFDEILRLIDETDTPLFNYTVTIQNHGPYGDSRFGNERRPVTMTTDLGDEANYYVNNYIQGLYYSDQALQSFIEALRQSDEPTMVVFFGDHLPMLGNDYLAYRKSGYIQDETDGELQADLKMMSVPFIAWKNYDQTSREIPVINASFLTPKILAWSGAELPDYLKAVSEMSERTPVMMRGYALDHDGAYLDAKTYGYRLSRGEYQLLGERIASEQSWMIADNSAYNQALNHITISNAMAANEGILIEGASFVPDMVLLVNQVETDFEYVSDDALIAGVTSTGSIELQLIEKNQAGNTAEVSNVYKWIP
jgi:hypothetical protein